MKDKKERAKFYVETDGWLIKTAVILMGFSMVLRLIGTYGMWNDRFFAMTQIALPLACNVLYAGLLLLCGRKFFWMTSLPVFFGVAFFIIKALTFDSVLHTVLCILLYLLVLVLYVSTAFGIIRTKWLLVPLFGLPFIYHIAVEDMAAMRAGNVTFSAGLQEMSVLCIMLSLLCVAFAMKKKKKVIIDPENNLPKMTSVAEVKEDEELGEKEK